jgi:hypothetical protein
MKILNYFRYGILPVQNTTLISIGLIADTGDTFYAELTDYDPIKSMTGCRKMSLIICLYR